MTSARILATTVRSACRPVALSVAIALALGTPAITKVGAADLRGRPTFGAPQHVRTSSLGGTTHLVTNCNDSGTGSLRDAVNSALSGDTVDLTELTCSTVTLSTGSVTIAANDLSIIGSGVDALTIEGSGTDRVFTHTGTGILAVTALAIRGGVVTSKESADGGCILSPGRVMLDHADIRDCTATGLGGARGGCIAAGTISLIDSRLETCIAQVAETSYQRAYGGAIHIGSYDGTVDLTRSSITDSSAIAPLSSGMGGGIFAQAGSITSSDSTLSGNSAIGAPYVAGFGNFSSDQGFGGAVFSVGSLTITGTTLFDNTATSGGAIANMAFGATPELIQITNSTISGNTASSLGGAIWSMAGGLNISNSSVTRNHAEYGAAGIMAQHWMTQDISQHPLQLHSTIIADNHAIYGMADIETVVAGVTIQGSNNFIDETNLPAPGDTLAGDPMLSPLADNGGPTWTHSPLPASPLIDAGNNVEVVEFDQRGPGFPRAIGAAVDIGAIEFVDSLDVIFSNGFD